MATEKVDYAEIASDVMEALEETGASGVLVHEEGDTYDDETSDVTASKTRTNIVAVFFPYEDRKINGTTILEDDLYGIIGAVGVPVPEKGDTIEWGSQKYKIVGQPKVYAPARVAVAYQVQVRA